VFLYGVSSVVAAHLSVKQVERVRFPLSPHAQLRREVIRLPYKESDVGSSPTLGTR
jgi:hypothetical protein